MADFSTTPDYFDSREVIERIEELTAEFIDATEGDPADVMSADDWAFGLSEDDAEELAALIEFRDGGADLVSDWEYGETFIRDDEFTSYTEEYLKDCGFIPADFPSWIAIDWDETADSLKQDYTSYDFRGETYWARS